MIIDRIKDRLLSFEGKIGINYIDLDTGYTLNAGNCDVFESSGLVMVFVMIEAFKRLEKGELKRTDKYTLKKSDLIKYRDYGVKGVGALSYLHEGLEVTIEDLYKLAIISADNVAFNILVDEFGVNNLKQTVEDLGIYKSKIRRKIYDFEKINKGIENTSSVQEMSALFYRLYRGQIVSNRASREMLDILKMHERNSVLGYYFDEKIEIAHFTSFDDEYVMDSGIVYSEKPFILTMCAHDKNVRNAESVMRDITQMCHNASQEGGKSGISN